MVGQLFLCVTTADQSLCTRRLEIPYIVDMGQFNVEASKVQVLYWSACIVHLSSRQDRLLVLPLGISDSLEVADLRSSAMSHELHTNACKRQIDLQALDA